MPTFSTRPLLLGARWDAFVLMRESSPDGAWFARPIGRCLCLRVIFKGFETESTKTNLNELIQLNIYSHSS
jgi:hypothetical protein